MQIQNYIRTLAVFLGLFVSISSCTDNINTIFDQPISARFDIPSGLNTVETHYFVIPNVPTFFKEASNNNNVDPSTVVKVLPIRGLIRGTFGSEDFGFIDRITIWAVSKKDPTVRAEIYYLDQVPFSVDNEIRLLSGSGNIAEIIKEDFINVEVGLTLRDFNSRNIPATIDFGYAVVE
jgi:hypothetical protein